MPQTEDHVRLTLVGLAHLPEAQPHVRDFLKVVSNMATRAAATPVSPTEIKEDWIDASDLIGMIEDGNSLNLPRLVMVQELIPHERPTWGGHVEGHSGTEWRYRLPADIARFKGVTDLDDYLLRSFGRSSTVASSSDATPAESTIVEDDAEWTSWCDPGLWSQVAPLIEIEHWDAVAHRATVYLEMELRRLGGLGRDRIGKTLVTAVLHPRHGSHPLASDEAEAGGWHQMALGYFATVRNNTNHGHVTDLDRRYAMGIVGTTSLLLTQMAIAYPLSA